MVANRYPTNLSVDSVARYCTKRYIHWPIVSSKTPFASQAGITLMIFHISHCLFMRIKFSAPIVMVYSSSVQAKTGRIPSSMPRGTCGRNAGLFVHLVYLSRSRGFRVLGSRFFLGQWLATGRIHSWLIPERIRHLLRLGLFVRRYGV